MRKAIDAPFTSSLNAVPRATNDEYDGPDILEGGQGNDTTIGGAGDDMHIYAGVYLGSDTVRDEYAGINHFDFSQFGGGINLDLHTMGSTQTVNTQHLRLRLEQGAIIAKSSAPDTTMSLSATPSITNLSAAMATTSWTAAMAASHCRARADMTS